MQNIFDNEQFFSGYQELRRKEQNSNDLIIDPALYALLPDLTDKTVLDIKTPRLIQFNYSSAEFAA